MLVSGIFFVETRLFPSLANTKFVFRNNSSPSFINPFYVFFPGRGILLITVYTGRLHPKKAPFSGLRGKSFILVCNIT